MNLSSWLVQIGQQLGWQNVAGVASSGASLLQVGYLQVGCWDETLHWLHVVCTDLSLGYLGGLCLGSAHKFVRVEVLIGLKRSMLWNRVLNVL